MRDFDLIIIGGGPAGLTAAIYGARAGLSVLVLEKAITGGQMRLTSEIENFPGFALVSGADLAAKLHEQAESYGVEIRIGSAQSLVIQGGRKLVCVNDASIEAGAVIIATGTTNKNLPCPGAKEFVGRGVSFCALCDAGFVRNEDVVVVGGGNAALEEANYLARYASRVTVVHRRDEFRALKAVENKARENPKIDFLLSSEVESIEGSDIVERIKVKDKKTGNVQTLKVGGVFMFVGKSPITDFLPLEIETTPGGWIKTNERMETSVPGVYAAGDVRETDLRQIVTAAADGARAALSAYHHLTSLVY
jgi:thioredoxin reductase (NADPH)